MKSELEKEKIKINRTKRKRERNLIKHQIKKRIRDVTNVNLNIGIQLNKDKEVWLVSWNYHFELPDDLDATNRKGIESEQHIVDLATTINKNIEDGIKHIFPNAHIIKNERNYNLTQPFPPMHIVRPDVFAHINGERIKIRDAYLMSSDEINEMLNSIDGNFKDTYANLIKNDLKRLQYFDFIGGSEFEHECFRLKRFTGMRVYGEFELPAEGEFRPSYLVK